MVTNLGFGLICLLIPVLIELFNLQASLSISNTGHTLFEVLILCGMYWLFMQILRLDERLYLRYWIKQKHISEPKGSVQPATPVEQTQTRQPLLLFKNGPKDHREVKL